MNQIMVKIFDYLKGVANPQHDSAEAKLFIALTAFGYILISAFVDLFTPLKPTEFVFYTVVSLIVACLGLGTYLGAKSMSVKGNVASDVVTEKPDREVTEEAKDILKSDKP